MAKSSAARVRCPKCGAQVIPIQTTNWWFCPDCGERIIPQAEASAPPVVRGDASHGSRAPSRRKSGDKGDSKKRPGKGNGKSS